MSNLKALLSPHSLTANAFHSPLGLGGEAPVLQWKLSSEKSGAFSLAWEVQAASTLKALLGDDADLFQSGKQTQLRINQCTYDGQPLASRRQVWWRVRVWDHTDTVSEWSECTSFELGLLNRSDWQADWVESTVKGGPRTCPPAPFFRKTFALRAQAKTARLHLSALGLYDCEINGHAISERVLAPGWTDFRKRVPVHSFDVSSFLREGENALGCILGEGWYSGHIANHHRQKYGERPSLLAQLEIVYEDGSSQVVVTDESWSTRTGPIPSNDLLMGESHDAREELIGWSQVECDPSGWAPVKTRPWPDIEPSPVAGPFVERHETLPIGPDQSPVNHEYFPWSGTKDTFDFGQNFTGRLRLRMRGKRGITVTIRHAEMLKPDGKIYTENLRSALCCDHYTLKGEGLEVYEPRFSFHGFRYAEISWRGSHEDLVIEKIEGRVLHTVMPPIGEFACSNPLLNQLQENIVWGLKSNYLEVPTDCPQRDERVGWTGDAQVFARTACFNRDVRAFFHKWMLDTRDAQYPLGEIPAIIPRTNDSPQDGGPAWSDANIICPWTIWRCYGDTRILKDHYVAMQRHLEFLIERSTDLIRAHPEAGGWEGFGDWLALDGGEQAEGHTLKDLIGTAFLAYDCELMVQIASALGQEEDATRYEEQHEAVKAAFNRRFVTADGYLASHTQTSYVLALRFELLPEDLRPFAAKRLVDLIRKKKTHLTTGFVGTPYLCHALEAHGYLDIAYELLEQETFPSWLFPVKNGATTIWERWDGWTPEKGFQNPEMNSFNHYAYGAIGAWMYESVAGLDLHPEVPGYRIIRFRPRPGGSLTWAEASLETPLGRASIRWERQDEELRLTLEVPVNAEAELDPPAGYLAPTTRLVSGKHELILHRV